MSINVANLELAIHKKIQTTTDSLEMLQLTKAAEQIKAGKIEVVATFASLPAVSSVTDGSLYLVTADEALYVAEKNTNVWKLLKTDAFGFIMSWGSNGQGRLGDGTTVDKSSPVSVVGGFADWCQVSAGFLQSVALRTNGTLWSWGDNGQGRLGDGTTVSKSSPVSVIGGFTDWCNVCTSNSHAVAIRTNGTLWAWGYNDAGRLGDGTIVNKSSPVSVVGGFTDWCQVSAGYAHNVGLRTNGTIWTWGLNNRGQLGDGTVLAKSSPVSVVGGFADWCQVSSGSAHTAALRTNGTMWAWGCNGQGRLGDDTALNKSSPVSVVGGFTDWCQVSGGYSHTKGIRTNGTLWAWGYNTLGQLGDGTTVSKSSPVSVIGGFTDWCQVSAGDGHSAALRTNGTLWTWGRNNTGRLGDGTTVNASSPVSVVGGFTDWCSVNVGFASHTLALRIKTF